MRLQMNRVPTHPGTVLLERILKPRQLSLQKAAVNLGVSAKHLSEITRAMKPVTPSMAYRIELATGFSAEMFLRMQIKHDLYQLRQQHFDDVTAIT
ncbi:HigA family addiction module antitoxin [Pseudidiomarina aestuarii]|uniref:HigA family addiction module antitoxin n=1 Tax=Pseudidiomarina aestuarii TaxID=624146 RepID=UPI003A97987D